MRRLSPICMAKAAQLARAGTSHQRAGRLEPLLLATMIVPIRPRRAPLLGQHSDLAHTPFSERPKQRVPTVTMISAIGLRRAKWEYRLPQPIKVQLPTGAVIRKPAPAPTGAGTKAAAAAPTGVGTRAPAPTGAGTKEVAAAITTIEIMGLDYRIGCGATIDCR